MQRARLIRQLAVVAAIVVAAMVLGAVMLHTQPTPTPTAQTVCYHKWLTEITVGSATPIVIEHDDPVSCPPHR